MGWKIGRPLSSEHRAKISRKLQGRGLGKTLSLEHRAKISKALLGRKLSPEHIAASSKGRLGIRLGVRLSPEHRAAISRGGIGKHQLSPEHREKLRNANLGLKKSKEQCEAMSISRKGKHSSPKTEFKKGTPKELHPRWKGGKTNLSDQIQHSEQYPIWRLSIFIRDGFTCVSCGQHGGRLQAHHMVARSKIIADNHIVTLDDALKCKLLWDENNGVTLCEDCHKLTDNYFSKARKVQP